MGGRVVVLISGSGTNMEALVEACQAGDVPGEVVAVVADRDCLGLRGAEKRDIPSATIQPGDFSSRDEWSDELRKVVEGYEPDLVVSAGFMRILGPSFVDAFKDRLINLHPSLLPAFPGTHGPRDALEFGAKVTGTTVHLIDNEVDHGPIILQEAIRVEQNDTEDSLHERIKKIEHRLLPHACRLMLEGRVRVQDGRVVVDQD